MDQSEGSEGTPRRRRAPTFRLAAGAWQYAVVGLGIVLIYAVGATFEWRNLAHDPILSRNRDGSFTPITGADRWWLIGLSSAGFFVLPWVLPLALWRIPAFSIGEAGLGLVGRNALKAIPWDQVHACHWDHHQRAGTLAIQLPLERVSIFIPERQRAKVEAELRRFGAWRG